VLIKRLENDEIDLDSKVQLDEHRWSQQAQSRLIESILIRLPIQSFYFDASDEGKWQIIDGAQRLSVIHDFAVKKDLVLNNLEFLCDFEGCTFDELPRPYARRILESTVSVYFVKAGSSALVKYSLFHRINTGGLRMTAQEIRHAMSVSANEGVASRCLQEMTENTAFQRVVSGNNHRMSHQELALRHVALILLAVEDYQTPLSRFLDTAMIRLGEADAEQRGILVENFSAAMELSLELFEHQASVNKPLFEAISVCLAKTDGDTRTKLLENKHQVVGMFEQLLANTEFQDAITRSTASVENVKKRLSMIMDTINTIHT